MQVPLSIGNELGWNLKKDYFYISRRDGKVTTKRKHEYVIHRVSRCDGYLWTRYDSTKDGYGRIYFGYFGENLPHYGKQIDVYDFTLSAIGLWFDLPDPNEV